MFIELYILSPSISIMNLSVSMCISARWKIIRFIHFPISLSHSALCVSGRDKYANAGRTTVLIRGLHFRYGVKCLSQIFFNITLPGKNYLS